jgi:hypothetical protein
VTVTYRAVTPAQPVTVTPASTKPAFTFEAHTALVVPPLADEFPAFTLSVFD